MDCCPKAIKDIAPRMDLVDGRFDAIIANTEANEIRIDTTAASHEIKPLRVKDGLQRAIDNALHELGEEYTNMLIEQEEQGFLQTGD